MSAFEEKIELYYEYNSDLTQMDMIFLKGDKKISVACGDEKGSIELLKRIQRGLDLIQQ